MPSSVRLAHRLSSLVLLLFGHAFTALPQSVHPRVQFVQVEQNVRVEVLDWGGAGKTMVFLAGGGNTAHVFDDFAPALATRYHVVGITRRGFGASSFSPVDRPRRFADDVLAVMDSLKLARVILVGHSIAGAELSALGAAHPARVAGLVYIEAGYPYAFRSRDGPTVKEFLDVTAAAPQAPAPRPANLTSYGALQRWDAQTFGFRTPESEFRQTWDSTADGRPVKPRDAPGFASMMTLLSDTTTEPMVRVPALVIFALPHVHDAWMDARARVAATAYYTRVDGLADRQANAVRKSLPNARVIRMRGRHYLYMSNASDVIHEIAVFIGPLK